MDADWADAPWRATCEGPLSESHADAMHGMSRGNANESLSAREMVVHRSIIDGVRLRSCILIIAITVTACANQASAAPRAEFHVTLKALRLSDGVTVTILNASTAPVPVSGFRANGAAKELNLLLRPIPPARFDPLHTSEPLVYKERWKSSTLKPGESRSSTLKWSRFDDFDDYTPGCYDAEIAYMSINDSGNTISNKVALGKICRNTK